MNQENMTHDEDNNPSTELDPEMSNIWVLVDRNIKANTIIIFPMLSKIKIGTLSWDIEDIKNSHYTSRCKLQCLRWKIQYIKLTADLILKNKMLWNSERKKGFKNKITRVPRKQ